MKSHPTDLAPTDLDIFFAKIYLPILIKVAKNKKCISYGDLVEKVINWTIENMQDSAGYFYYQKKKFWTTKIPYMRWSQAWMTHSLMIYKISKNV